MRKSLVALMVIGLLILGGAQVALAADTAVNGKENPCFLNLLPEDARQQAEDILSNLHARLSTLRARLSEYRGTLDRENMDEVREEMWELKREAREQIAPLLPEEHRERFMNREYMRQHRFQPEDRPVKGGGNGNSFGRQR